MNITVANLSKEVTKAQSAKLPGVLKDSYTDVVDMLDLYNDDSDIKKYIDTYVSKLNQHYAKATPPAKPQNKYKVGDFAKVNKHGWIMKVSSVAISDGKPVVYLKNDKRGTMNGNVGSYFLNEITKVDPLPVKATPKKKTQPKKAKATLLKIVWHEGTGEFDKKKFATWRDLQAAFIKIHESYIKSGGSGYDKVKLEIEWENDKKINPRIDVGKNKEDFNPTKQSIGSYLYENNVNKDSRDNLLFEDYAKTPPKKAPPPPKKKVTSTTTKKADTSGKTKKPATPATQVAEIAIEVRFIKRYVLMDGKKKTRKQLLAFISSLQRAIEKKQIRKTSKYASEIIHIQKELLKIHNDDGVGDTFTFKLDDTDKKVIAKFTRIAKSQQQRTSVRLISRFIGIHGRTAVKEKAERLLKAIKAAITSGSITSTDPYHKQIKEVEGNLHKYIKAHDSKLQIGIAELKGLQGIAGLMEQDGKIKPGDTVELPFGGRDTVRKVTDKAVFLKKHKGLVNKKFVKKIDGAISTLKGIDGKPIQSINSLDFKKMVFTPIGFTGKWLNMLGDPVFPFSMLWAAKEGKGKSTLAIEFAHYLAETFNYKVLWATYEEGVRSTTKDKFTMLNAFHENILITSGLPADLTPYDIVFIDSITEMEEIGQTTPADFELLKEKYYPKSFITIAQMTTGGKYRGSTRWGHNADLVLYINDNGYAMASKGRFGDTNSVKVFKGKPDKIYRFTHLQDAEKFVSNRKDEKLRILNGNDGKKWVTNPDKAKELSKQGYEIY